MTCIKTVNEYLENIPAAELVMTMARLKVMNLKENVHQDDIIKKKIALVLQFKDRKRPLLTIKTLKCTRFFIGYAEQSNCFLCITFVFRTSLA